MLSESPTRCSGPLVIGPRPACCSDCSILHGGTTARLLQVHLRMAPAYRACRSPNRTTNQKPDGYPEDASDGSQRRLVRSAGLYLDDQLRSLIKTATFFLRSKPVTLPFTSPIRVFSL